MSLEQLLHNVPLGGPPPGQVSNFIDPPSLGPVMIATCTIFTALMLVMVGARMYVRSKITKKFWWDDYLIIVAAISCIVGYIILVYSMKAYGLGRHRWNIRLLTVTKNAVRVVSSIVLLYSATLFMVKTSIALLYYKIFGVTRAIRWCIYGFILFCMLFYGGTLGLNSAQLSQCVPSLSVNPKLCMSFGPVQVLISILNVATELYLMILPLPIIMKLQLGPKQKAGVLAAFGCGSIACAASVVRLAYISVLSVRTVENPNEDTVYDSALLMIPSFLEINAGIIAASIIPTRRIVETALFKRKTYSRFFAVGNSNSKSSRDGKNTNVTVTDANSAIEMSSTTAVNSRSRDDKTSHVESRVLSSGGEEVSDVDSISPPSSMSSSSSSSSHSHSHSANSPETRSKPEKAGKVFVIEV